MLGSWLALIPGGVSAALIILRTVLEDRILLAELAGYKEFAERTRYRLLPGIW
jgi:protein-S-isoprenylcysteine O-methyltransferase Ste14